MKTPHTKSRALLKIAAPALLLAPYLLWHGATFAQELDSEPASTISLPASTVNSGRQNSHWSASLLYGFVDYSEPGLMSETGSLAGVGLTYSYAFREIPLVLRLEGEYLYGQLTYTGSTWAGQPLTTPTTDNMLNGRALVGFQLQPIDGFTVTPFLGIATRYLNDEIIGSYDREITYYYAPIGADFTFGVANHWALSVSGEYDDFLSGSAVSHIDQSNSAYPTVDNSQSSGYGYRLTAGLEHGFNSGWSLKISPYLVYWKIQQSDMQTFVANNITQSVYEPNNSSTMYGVKISFVF